MTDEQIKTIMIEWAADYCNVELWEETPDAVTLFAEQAVTIIKSADGNLSESLGKYSVSKMDSMPKTLLGLLRPYRKVYRGC